MSQTIYQNGIPSSAGLFSGASTDKSLRRAPLLLKGGRIVDPKNGVDSEGDLLIQGGFVIACGDVGEAPASARTFDCRGTIVMPGLVDMHLHLGDLFEVCSDPVGKAARDGVTCGLSPGAGNTFMAPSLLGAEVDRGLPISVGVYVGAAAFTSTRLDADGLVALIKGELGDDAKAQLLSRNAIVNATANRIIGVKDHMGHGVMSDERLETVFDVTSRAGLVFMTHTQDFEHACRLAALSKGRPLHLGHATAAGCGTHGNALRSFAEVLSLVGGNITAEFVGSMLLPTRGRRDGLKIDEKARQLALRALHDKKVCIVVSDGQPGATMKGFGDTADNLKAILYLASDGVLSLPDSVALMTCNPVGLIEKRTGCAALGRLFGHLGAGALGNVTVVDPASAEAVLTVACGEPVSFDGNLVREGGAAGGFVCRDGFFWRTGVGDLALYGG